MMEQLLFWITLIAVPILWLAGLLTIAQETSSAKKIFILAMLLGALIWTASPSGKQAWDIGDISRGNSYYFCSLISAGGIASLMGRPGLWWVWPIAICLGQDVGVLLMTLQGHIYWAFFLTFFFLGVSWLSPVLFFASGIVALLKRCTPLRKISFN